MKQKNNIIGNNAKHAIFLSLVFTLFTVGLTAQVGINTDDSDPDPSAMLDVKSTDKGMLIPRMTTAQRTTIAAPATGLLVFDNDLNAFYYFDGNDWTALVTSNLSTLQDADNDTKIQVEKNADEDIIRFDVAGNEAWRMEESMA